MQYVYLDADFGRNDLYYIRNLVKSLNTDLDALISAGPSAYTEARSKLLMDKVTLYSAASEIYNSAAPESLFSDSINSSLKTEINLFIDKLSPKLASVEKLTPALDVSNVTISPYKDGVPFTSPPVAFKGTSTAPAETVLSKLNFPITLTPFVVTPGAVPASGKAGAGYFQSITSVAARSTPQVEPSKGGIAPLAIGAAAVAALFFLNR